MNAPYEVDEAKVIESIKKQLAEHSIFLYMKGTPALPQCGFSSQAVAAVRACGKAFSFINILEHPDIRAVLPKYANWPTFPQLYIKGELIGGADIILEMQKSGELQEAIDNI